MELLYIREQDFHLASEEEQDDILSHYEKKNRKIKNNQKNIHWTFGYFLL